MAIESTYAPVRTAGGGLTDFDFPFPFFSPSDILVYTIDKSTTPETATLKTLTTHYILLDANGVAISQDGFYEGGTVRFTAAVSGLDVFIGRDIDFTQPIDVPTAGLFREQTLERALDRLAMQVQQIDNATTRSLLLPVTSETGDLELPEPEANKVLGWNSAGTGLENKDAIDKSYLAQVEAARDAAAASESNSANSETMAEKWAEEDEDTEVEAGKYSAKHYAAKAADSADSIDPVALSLAIRMADNPIGTVRTFGVPTNPATLLGFGTWTAIAGKVIVGIDATQTEFDTLNGTGGEKTHTLVIDEIPRHRLPIAATEGYGVGTGRFAGRSSPGTSEWTGYTDYIGGDGAHNNLQPYIVKYVWERTA